MGWSKSSLMSPFKMHHNGLTDHYNTPVIHINFLKQVTA